MTRSKRLLRLMFLSGLLAVSTAVVVPSPASAEEVFPGLDVTGATVSGPGLAAPVDISDSGAADLLKTCAGTGFTNPAVVEPPADAVVFTVRFMLNSNEGTLRWAANSKGSWISCGDLLDRGEFMASAPAAAAAMKPALDRARSNGAFDGSESDDGLGTGLVIGIVAGAGVLVGAMVVLLRRRQAAASNAPRDTRSSRG